MKQRTQRKSTEKISKMEDKTGHSRYLIAFGIFGYLLCLIADIILEILPNGELTWESISEKKLFIEAVQGTTPNRFAMSAVLGVSSMIFITLGLVGISEYVNMYSKIASEIMLIGGVGSSVLGAGFHFITTTIVWILVALDGMEEAFKISELFSSNHNLIFQINPFFYMLFSGTLLVVIVAGKTPLPRWTCVFNIAILFMILSKFNVHGASSIAGLLMCIGLFIFTGIFSNKKGNNKKTE